MRYWRDGAVALILAVGLAGSSAAQIKIEDDNSGVGTTSAEFLMLGAGARGMAVGSGFAAIVRDVESVYYNPAGLPLMEGPEAGLTVMPYFADTDYLWAGLALPLANGEWGLGFSVQNFGFEDAVLTTAEDPFGDEGLRYDVSETAVGLSIAHAFIDRFTGGVTLKYVSSSLGKTRASAFAVDVGTNFHTEWNNRPIAMSFVIQNLGTPMQHQGPGLQQTAIPETDDPTAPQAPLDPYAVQFMSAEWSLPVVFRVGVAYDVISSDANRLSLIGQFNEPNGNDASVGFGGEYEWSPANLPLSAALRGSYDYQPDNDFDGEGAEVLDAAIDAENSASMDGLTIGAGLEYSLGDLRGGFDYAWRNFGVLGSRNVFTLSVGW